MQRRCTQLCLAWLAVGGLLFSVSGSPAAADGPMGKRSPLAASALHDAGVGVPHRANQGKKGKASAKVDPVTVARKTVEFANEQVKNAMRNLQDASGDLRKIESDLENSQESDSHYAVAKAKFEKAQRVNKVQTERVFDLPENRAELERLNSDPNRSAEAVANLRAAMIAKDAVASAVVENLEQARREYTEIRQKLLRDDPGWQAASDKVKSVRAEYAAAEREQRQAVVEKNRLEEQAERARRTLEKAKAAQREANLEKKQAEAAKEARQRAIQNQKARQKKLKKRR